MGVKRLERRAERVANRQAKLFRKEDMGQKFNKSRLNRLSDLSDDLQVKIKEKKGAPFYKTGGFMGINPDHKGYCTPMTKPTCTPRRKALAKRLKPGGDLYKGKK